MFIAEFLHFTAPSSNDHELIIPWTGWQFTLPYSRNMKSVISWKPDAVKSKQMDMFTSTVGQVEHLW